MSPFKRAAAVTSEDVLITPSKNTVGVKEVKDFGNRIVIVNEHGGEERHNPDDQVEVV